jgi:hypothetical protein
MDVDYTNLNPDKIGNVYVSRIWKLVSERESSRMLIEDSRFQGLKV